MGSRRRVIRIVWSLQEVLVIGPDKPIEGLRDVSLTQGQISDLYLPASALHGPHCLSHDFTWSGKPTLEKQTRQLSLVMQQCMHG